MLQPNEFKIYNASAGAGKTYTLVKEYLSILLSKPNPNSFQSILAITFTNKAAQEMKKRILEQLVHFSKSNYLENKDLLLISSELEIEPEIIHQRSKESLTHILHNYSKFSVSTIDKFNLRLMKSFAQDLGLSSNFNVEMDLDKLLEESVDQLFSRIGEDEVLTSILIEIALDNLNENKSWDITRELIQNTYTLYSDTHLPHLNSLKKFSLEEFNEFRRTVYRNVASRKKGLIEIGNQVMEILRNHQISTEEFSYGNSGFIGFFLKLKNENFEFPGTRHETFKENTDPKKWVSSKANSISKETIREISPTLIGKSDEAILLLKELAVWESMQKTITSLSILNEVEKSIENIKEDNNVLLISEFNKLISSHLQNQPSGFIYERIGNRFHHYFIDEFQDTSTLQWENLGPLIENARAGSDTVMLVGDAKQSIYRWRGGNPEQMVDLIKKKDEKFIQLETLPKNWRSFTNIIDFNNQFYSTIATKIEVDAYKSLYLEGNQQLTNDKNGGYVQVNFFPKNVKDDDEYTYKETVLDQLLHNINEVKEQEFELNEMAILHRTKAEGKLIAEFLSKNEIPILSSESLLVSNSPEIQLIELFFKTLSNEEDKVAKSNLLIQILNSTTLSIEDPTKEILKILHQPLKKLPEFLSHFSIDINFAFQPSVSLYDFTEKTIIAFGLGKNGTAYLQNFLDYVLEYSNQNEYNLKKFLENWDVQKENLSISSPEGVKAAQLMTIHKSKGLEFPVVLIPFADWGSTEKADQFWIPIQQKELPFENFLVNSYGNLDQVSDELKELVQKGKNEFLLDNLNMLYVATTRAVEQLYIITQSDAKKGVATYFSEQFLNENLVYNSGEKVRKSEAKESSTPSITIPFVSENWEERIEISKESSKRWKKKKEIVHGELIHDLMQYIYTENDIEKTLLTAQTSGQILKDDFPDLKKSFLSIVQHPQLKDYFSGNYKILNERTFIDDEGEIYRPDKIIFNGNSCSIMDYKTGSPKEMDEIQINYYASNLQKMGYEIEKKFVIYIHEQIEVREIM